MTKHLKYLSYVLRHKWYVAQECFRHGLYWCGVMHDLSKFLPSEWFPYVNFFYGEKAEPWRDSTGYYKPTDTGDAAFDFAWLLHQKRNDHHWQWWILPEDSGGEKVLEMPYDAVVEMICDWRGAGKAQGTPDTLAWYTKNKDKMRLHPNTRDFVEVAIGYCRPGMQLFDCPPEPTPAGEGRVKQMSPGFIVTVGVLVFSVMALLTGCGR